MTELARTVNRAWLYEGQESRTSARARRHVVGQRRRAGRCVYCLQNHDQVGNRAFGKRLSSIISIDEYRAGRRVLMLLPYTPLMFMGQEFAASSPFLYFTDHNAEVGRAVSEGRFAEFAAHESDEERLARFPDPQALPTFLECKLDLSERNRAPGKGVLALYDALLRIRRDDAIVGQQDRTTTARRRSTTTRWSCRWGRAASGCSC